MGSRWKPEYDTPKHKLAKLKWKRNNRAKVTAYFRLYRYYNHNRIYAVQKVWCANNRQKIKEYHITFRKKNVHSRLPSAYGINGAEYHRLLKAQHGMCAICGQPGQSIMKGKKIRLCVDHNHTTGKVRALLCNGCNSVVGHSHENILVLKAAIAYLRKHNGTGRHG